MSDERTRIDDAIDCAVRDIMRREPPAGFRGRVLSRLHEPARRARLWPALAVAGALTVVVVGLTVVRDSRREPPGANRPAVERQAPAAAAPAEAVPPRSTASRRPAQLPAHPHPRPEPVRTAAFGPRDGRISAASLTPAPGERSASANSPSLDVESAPPEPQSIVVPALAQPPPLEITPIVVPPIQIPRMQNAQGSPPR